jgi:hypothetical protein
MTIVPGLKQELLAAARREVPSPAARSWPRWVTRRRVRPPILALAAALVVAAGAAAAVTRLAPDDRPPGTPASQLRTPAPRPGAPASAQTALFSVLLRPRQHDDALPDSVTRTLSGPAQSATHGESPDLSRRLHHPDRAVWLTVGADTVCYLVKVTDGEPGGDTAGGCQPTAAAAQGLLQGYETGGARFAGKAVVTGILPDGIPQVTVTYADGSTQSVPVIDNVYAFTTDQTARVSFTDAQGTRHTLPAAIVPVSR